MKYIFCALCAAVFMPFVFPNNREWVSLDDPYKRYGRESVLVSQTVPTMKAQVVLDVYSGMPNPTWDLSSAQIDSFLKMAQTFQKVKKSNFFDGLGYRGIYVVMSETNSKETIYRIQGKQIAKEVDPQTVEFFTDSSGKTEKWLLSLGKELIDPDLYKLLIE